MGQMEKGHKTKNQIRQDKNRGGSIAQTSTTSSLHPPTASEAGKSLFISSPVL